MIYDTQGQGGYLLIGVVGKPFGLKGHVRVRPFTDDPERFFDLERMFFEENGKYVPVGIAETDVNGEVVTLLFEGVEDRTAAEKLNGKSLFIKREEAVEPPPGAHFIMDMIGCAVSDSGGNFLGNLAEVLQHRSADVYVLRGGPKGEILFPALKTVMVSVDTAAKRIIVDAGRFKEVAVFED